MHQKSSHFGIRFSRTGKLLGSWEMSAFQEKRSPTKASSQRALGLSKWKNPASSQFVHSRTGLHQLSWKKTHPLQKNIRP